MKKISLLIICFGFFISFSSNAQNKTTFWLHGLGDNDKAWLHYATIFEAERQMNSNRPDYTSNAGVVSSTATISGRITPNLQNIGIGHSMGGVVLRNLDRVSSASSRRINGLITVASPNSGAGIANSFDDQSLLKASQKACTDISAGPSSELFSLPWKMIELKFASSIGASLTSKALCELFVTNDLLEKYAGSATARADLKMGSPLLSQINTQSSSIPRLTMIAEENRPVHWRMLSSTLTRNNSSPSDQLLPDVITGVEVIYNGFFVARTSGAVANAILGFINPILFAKAALNTYKATKWKKGVDWLRDSETIWNGLTKASRLESERYWVWTWIPCETIPGRQLLIDDIGRDRDQSCGEWGFVERTRQVMVHYPSDGFIPSYSQDIASLPASNRYFIQGANHIEVLNMSNSKLNGQPNDATKREFNRVFDERNDIFRTARR
ncbi:MAG: esterase/lipase family protein [Mongoliitalea sp.]